MLKQISISLAIVTIISVVFGFALRHLTGFWEATSAVFVLQFLLFYFAKFENKNVVVSDIEQQAYENLLQTQIVAVNCPCGQTTMKVPILLNEDNIFTCNKCSSKFKVNATFDSILLTEPLNIANAFEALIQKDKERELSYNKL
jgi:hypothetical protein